MVGWCITAIVCCVGAQRVNARPCPVNHAQTDGMSAIFFLNEAGKPLLSRNFKGDVPMNCVEVFPQLLQENSTPCFEYQGVHYIYIRHADLILLCVSETAYLNVMSIFHFLYRVIDSFAVFVQNVEVESVIDNFVVLYELLDEMMDFGIVQTTDTNLLQDYVTQSSYKLEVSQAVSALTDSVSWRPPGIWYKKNELFVDVIETVSTTVNRYKHNDKTSPDNNDNNENAHTPSEATTVNVVGNIKVRSFLSGMPHLTLSLNDIPSLKGLSYHRASRHVVLDDIAFHQCVDLDTYERDHKIQFIPPDGTFDLLTYRVRNRSKAQGGAVAMFKVDPVIEIRKNSRVIVSCAVKAQYKRRQHCRKLEIALPVPKDCDSPRCRSSAGSVVYVPEQEKVIWRLHNFGGGDEASMQAELLLAHSDPKLFEEDVALVNSVPVTLNFEMPGSVNSGLHIKYLKIKEDLLKYQALPWVRYLTKSGEYEVRHA